jgi:hypothetical protein
VRTEIRLVWVNGVSLLHTGGKSTKRTKRKGGQEEEEEEEKSRNIFSTGSPIKPNIFWQNCFPFSSFSFLREKIYEAAQNPPKRFFQCFTWLKNRIGFPAD